MKFKAVYLLLFVLFLVSCNEPEARRPITASKSYTLASTASQLKQINKIEEAKIQDYIQKDSSSNYIASQNGFWYQYLNKIEEEFVLPKKK